MKKQRLRARDVRWNRRQRETLPVDLPEASPLARLLSAMGLSAAATFQKVRRSNDVDRQQARSRRRALPSTPAAGVRTDG